MRRVLLAVGVAVLLSLMIVPYGGHNRYDSGQSFYFREPFFLDHKGWPMVADQLILQTVFLGVLAAVIVNIRSWPCKKPREKVARAALRFEHVLTKNSNCADSGKPLIVNYR
jgi:hypothetical protein